MLLFLIHFSQRVLSGLVGVLDSDDDLLLSQVSVVSREHLFKDGLLTLNESLAELVV